MVSLLFTAAGIVLLVAILIAGVRFIKEGNVAVVTMFGRYQRTLHPGLNFIIPLIEEVFTIISTQNRSIEQSFQAITIDQANVYFKTMVVYSVLDAESLTIRKAAFKFRSETELMQALTRSIEGIVRSFVATKPQANILGVRRDLVDYVKVEMDRTLLDWGYHVEDAQITDITFDAAVLRSMEQRVAAQNIRAAVQELKEVGISYDALQMDKWMESLKYFAENGTGNTIFLDGSPDNMQRTQKQLMSVMQNNQ